VFGLDDYELVTESSGVGGLGNGGAGAAGASATTGGAGSGADGGSGGEAVAVPDCCIDERPPEGWEYAIVSRIDGDEGAPTCLVDGSQPRVFLSGEPGPAECGAQCACGNPSGGTCSQSLTCYSDADCGGGSATVGSNPCNVLIPSRSSCMLARTVETDAGCTPAAASSTLPGWTFKHLACPDKPEMASADGCEPGQHCASGAQGAVVCIWKEDLVQCPEEGGFTELVEVFDGDAIDDSRACDGCFCSSAPTDCTGGSFHYGSAIPLFTCNTTSSSTTCVNTGGIETAGIKSDATVMIQGACSPSGAPTPMGNITGQVPYTLCCRSAF